MRFAMKLFLGNMLIIVLVFAGLSISSYYTSSTEEEFDRDLFFSECYSSSDELVFIYNLRTSNYSGDYYASYSITKDKDTIINKNNKLYENVSINNPIVIEIQRDASSKYEI
ncbi:hypothetical protein [Methanohalophilus sp.]|uniref:hypothetical protein n=1 Tax=Methanohalophilus sp. TaxID=1966352 RepID=UPI0026309128|nr:hypothetical protein [Methanohalophilus sp.]MDK2891785.1 hypothetical protein [Methanohalophilus sp.]